MSVDWIFFCLFVNFFELLQKKYLSSNVDQGSVCVAGACLKRLKAVLAWLFQVSITFTHREEENVQLLSDHLITEENWCKRKIKSPSCWELKARVDVATIRQTINQRVDV